MTAWEGATESTRLRSFEKSSDWCFNYVQPFIFFPPYYVEWPASPPSLLCSASSLFCPSKSSLFTNFHPILFPQISFSVVLLVLRHVNPSVSFFVPPWSHVSGTLYHTSIFNTFHLSHFLMVTWMVRADFGRGFSGQKQEMLIRKWWGCCHLADKS